MNTQSTTFERHYRIGELCVLWGIGRETLRKILLDEPGVVKIRMGRRKSHTTYSVPASVAERIHTRLSSGDERMSLSKGVLGTSRDNHGSSGAYRAI
jgi:hypothetical protein